jgi:bacteriocin biosynthesis cyclodehydratase domain-containing protein
MQRPRIKRTTERLETPEGDIYLMRPSAGRDFRIEQPNEEQRQLLAALDGEQTVDQLLERFDEEEVRSTIAQFQELGVVEDAADDDLIPSAEMARFDRQLRYFSDVGPPGLTPSVCQQRLREAKLAVLGVGGLGGSAAMWLATVGIGELWLVDGDRVEVSNLNRQVLYEDADIGELKVEKAAARLRAFNPSLSVRTATQRLESQAEISEFIAGADVVVDAADWPAHEIERWCNAACFESGVPYITMSHFPPIARVGPLYVPGVTGCFVCQESAYRRESPFFELAVAQRRAQPSPAATLGPACGMIGGQVALEVMHLLTGLAEPSTLGVAHISDLRTLMVERETVVPEPDCPVCGHLSHRDLRLVPRVEG